MKASIELAYIAKTLLEDAEVIDIRSGVSLTPSQEASKERLFAGMSWANVCVLRGASGFGKSTILRELQTILGGDVLNASAFMSLLRDRRLLAIDETFLELVGRSLARTDIVFVDDFNLITAVVENYEYPRLNLFNMVLTSLLSEANARRKKLIFATTETDLASPMQRSQVVEIGAFTEADYRHVLSTALGWDASRLDIAEVFRFAPGLDGYQLSAACAFMASEGRVSTDAMTAYLIANNLASNIDLQQVEPVTFADLKGADDLVGELEAKIVLPFENAKLAAELKLKPKRGVLLAGPPGTGKTTIGRALAHRLKSKFFLIDGTVVAGSRNFYDEITKIFNDAKKNAPAIIFIDDADVLFEDDRHGFYRYLLTMMDGLESASTGRVCVMMTAMEVSSLPPAMLRSGRVELWLETRLPDDHSRRQILAEKLRELPPPLPEADMDRLVAATRGLTGADLKAVIEDAKLLFAHDLDRNGTARQPEYYFTRAITTAREKRTRYARRAAQPFGGKEFGFAAADARTV